MASLIGTEPHDLTDSQWTAIAPLLPKHRAGAGRPRRDDRVIVNGILYVLKTGCTWDDMPRRYGSPITCWARLRQWHETGIWEKVWLELLKHFDAQAQHEWVDAFLKGSFVPSRRYVQDTHKGENKGI